MLRRDRTAAGWKDVAKATRCRRRILQARFFAVNTQKNIVIFRILGYNKVTNQHPQKKKNMKKKVGL